MPPRKSGKTLTPRQIELLKMWIDQGASWSQHWAFEPPKRKSPPSVDGSELAEEPDRCVRPRPSRRGEARSPSAEADRTALIRRVSLDLTGLPPSPAEVDDFLADHGGRRLRAAGRSAAGLAQLRRTDGDGMAGRGPIRRHQRLSERLRPHHVALARLGHRRVQRQPAVRSVHDRPDRWRPAARGQPLPADRHRLQSKQPDGHRGRLDRGGMADREQRGPGRDDIDGLPRPNDGMCSLPRPQVRPDLAVRVLPVLRLLQQRQREGSLYRNAGQRASAGGTSQARRLATD